MRDLERRLTALSPAKRALFARRLDAVPRAGTGPRPRPRQPGLNTFRTSFAQERLWFLEQVAPGTAAFNIVGAYRAVGPLDVAALRRSLAVLMARHETLRTTFVSIAGTPYQVVSPRAPLSLCVRAVRRTGTEAERFAEALSEVAREAARPFDVAFGPLLRVLVFDVGDDLRLIGVVMHHLIADAWSLDVFVRELAAIYGACLRGVRPALGPPALQYADYAEWQRERFAGAPGDTLASYWRRQLTGVPYPEVGTGDRLAFRGAARRLSISPETSAAVRGLARREGITLFEAMLAAWQSVLARWIGQEDVTVLAPMANRDRSEVAETLGFFVNLVALRGRLADNPSFREHLARVKAVVRGALLHQELPFEMVLSALGVERTLERPPLSPFAFAIEQSALTAISLPNVRLSAVELDTATSRTDVALMVGAHERQLSLRLEWGRDLYTSECADGLLHDLVQCLERGVADPERRLSDLIHCRQTAPTTSTAPAADGALAAADGAAVPTVWTRFVVRATASPDWIAVRDAGIDVHYGELHRDASTVASTLAAAGLEPQSIVAVWGERGRGWIATMLAVWSRGGVYLPLDPRWPDARVRQVLTQSRARVMVAPGELPRSMRAVAREASCRVLELDGVGRPTQALPSADVRASDLAYVMYTSGSTGTPTGALIEHAALSNHLEAKVALLELTARDRVAQTAAAGFDISLWQVLAPLVVGATVAVLDEATVRDPSLLAAAVRACDVTVLETVPAVLQLMVEHANVRALAGLRWLVVTGEALPPALARAWFAHHPTIPLVNAYGPTECADDVTHHVLRTAPPREATRVPIGRAIPGANVHVLDAELRSLPSGDEGEICVGGTCVGRGYLHAPSRTAARFVVPDPFDGRAGSRLYRTGDRGRWTPDGTLEWLGRMDEQVKIRGTRVEPGEVEVVLRAHAGIRHAAVVARGTSEAATHLVAYVVADVTTAELRRYLAKRLPAAMVPAAFVHLAALPLTANGKVDRRALALRPLDGARTPDGRTMTPTERLVADLVGEVLGVTVVSPEANFFTLGGDSLSSIRLVASARRHGLILTPRQVFEHQTIAALAALAARAVGPAPEQGLVVGDVPLTPIQRMLLEADVSGRDHYNMAMLLEIDGPLVPESLAIAVEHLMRHHDALRLRLRHDGVAWRSHIAGLDGEVPFEAVDLAALADTEVSATLEAHAAAVQRTLDLAEGPIVRVVAFDLGPTRASRVLVVIHHVACDAASWPTLLEDLGTLYEQVQHGAAIRLPAKTTSYQAWARRLDEHRRAPERAEEIGFWKAECREPVRRLPVDTAAGMSRIVDVARVTETLDVDETARVLHAAAGRGVTVEVVLLTALSTSLADWAGCERILVYLERHGRARWSDLDLSRTVGWFTAVFPMSLRVAASRVPADTLVLLDLHLREVPDGGVGYGVCRYAEDAHTAKTLRALPQPEVSFNYLGRIDPPSGGTWRVAPESPGKELGLRGRRPTVLDVTASLADGRLGLVWDYDAVRHRRATIAAVVARFLAVVRELTRDVS